MDAMIPAAAPEPEKLTEDVEKLSLSPFGVARSSVNETPLTDDEVRLMTDYFHASMYMCLGMIYLRRNPLLREPLTPDHLKRRLLGHWGSDAGQSFTYIHMNRLIKKYDLDALFISGPGHGAPAVLSNSYLEGVYSEVYPDKKEDEEGLRRFFKYFSFPGGIGSHATPETPGSLHEGGELGYSISHAFGAVFDHPDLIALTMVGDGESETGPLATSWHSTKFLNPITDGAVLPVLHLNGYKVREYISLEHPYVLTITDQQPYSPLAYKPQRARTPFPRLRLDTLLCRGQRLTLNAPGHGRYVGALCHEDKGIPEGGSRLWQGFQASLAYDRPPHA